MEGSCCHVLFFPAAHWPRLLLREEHRNPVMKKCSGRQSALPLGGTAKREPAFHVQSRLLLLMCAQARIYKLHRANCWELIFLNNLSSI